MLAYSTKGAHHVVDSQKVEPYEERLDAITEVKRQVYGKGTYGPGTVTRMDGEMRAALRRMSEYYDTSESWVIRLAIKKFIYFFERNTHVRVYFPERSPRSDGDGGGGRYIESGPPADRPA